MSTSFCPLEILIADTCLFICQFRMAKVRLVNDFVANGYGLLTLDHAKECICLQKGEYMEGAPKACVGAGTGLGECFSTAAPEPGASYETFPSEGGHAEFAPRNDLEMELLNFLKKKFEQKHRVSVERVVSGPGLANIYEFLSSKFPRKVTKQVQQEFDAATDLKGKVVAMHSQKDGQPPYCELCDQAMDIFLAAYGSECGVACLKWIPFGGMYVAGGLTPKNIHRLTEANSPFMGAFYDKGRLTPLLRRVPLYAVMVEDIGVRWPISIPCLLWHFLLPRPALGLDVLTIASCLCDSLLRSNGAPILSRTSSSWRYAKWCASRAASFVNGRPVAP